MGSIYSASASAGQPRFGEITAACNLFSSDFSPTEGDFLAENGPENVQKNAIRPRQFFLAENQTQVTDFYGNNDTQDGLIPASSSFIHTGDVKNNTPRPRGRPRKDRPWHELSEWRGLAVSRYVDNDDAKAMLKAGEHSKAIGRPLNTMLTIRHHAMDDMPVEERSTFWRGEIEQLHQHSRRRDRRARGFSGASMLWAREANVDGSHEHLHIAIHVKGRDVSALLTMMLRRYGTPECRETIAACMKHCPDALADSEFGSASWSIDLAASLAPRPVGSKLGTLATYLVKNLRGQKPGTNLANVPRRPGGSILGKRVGWSSDLSPKSIEAWSLINRRTV